MTPLCPISQHFSILFLCRKSLAFDIRYIYIYIYIYMYMTSRVYIPGIGYRYPDVGYRYPDVGYRYHRYSDVGYRYPDVGYKYPDVEYHNRCLISDVVCDIVAQVSFTQMVPHRLVHLVRVLLTSAMSQH